MPKHIFRSLPLILLYEKNHKLKERRNNDFLSRSDDTTSFTCSTNILESIFREVSVFTFCQFLANMVTRSTVVIVYWYNVTNSPVKKWKGIKYAEKYLKRIFGSFLTEKIIPKFPTETIVSACPI